ncbi:MAG: hypothetical protein HQM08_23695 [Candidatus Riflebacteria bacterium]|nr:hypothetical protein [Candidatus Riflebacteria bacterium]
MNLSLSLYRRFLALVTEIFELFPPRRVDREEIILRKGQFIPQLPVNPGTIWVHGASLGETITLRPFMRQLNKRFGPERILATATSMDGLRQIKRDAYAGHATLLPIELPELLDPFIECMKPSILLISETEIWPFLGFYLSKKGIPCGIINGRINPKTVKFLQLLHPLFQDTLRSFSFVFAQSQAYAERFRTLGIPSKRIKVLGSFKFDFEDEKEETGPILEKFGLSNGKPIFIAGSTHADEEKQLLDAFEKCSCMQKFQIVFAPRHLDRIREVANLLTTRKIEFVMSSELKRPLNNCVLLLNQLGMLRKLYSVSNLVFVGGSLIPRGGHNILEPAVYSIPIISGPHTTNFPQEIRLLKKMNALFTVENSNNLSQLISSFISDRQPFIESGKRARKALETLSGASQRTLGILNQIGLLPDWKPITQN